MSCREELLNLLIQKAAWRASAAEEQRIEELLDENPALWEDYREWEADLPTLREAVGLATAQHTTDTPMPEGIRERLMDHMRDRFPNALETEPALAAATTDLSWRWALVPAFGLIVVFLISLNMMQKPEANPGNGEDNPPDIAKNQNPPQKSVTPTAPPQITVALLDVVGQTRSGGGTIKDKLQKNFTDRKIETFKRTSQATEWMNNWPAASETKGPVIKMLYNASAGRLTLIGHIRGEQKNANFTLNDPDELPTLNDPDELPTLIDQARATLDEWLADKPSEN